MSTTDAVLNALVAMLGAYVIGTALATAVPTWRMWRRVRAREREEKRRQLVERLRAAKAREQAREREKSADKTDVR